MPDKQIRPFSDFLAELNNGTSAVQLSEQLNELVTAVADLGKGGTLTYKVTVKPAAHAESMVVITDEITLKPPVGARPDSIWFVTSDGNVTRDNPQQPHLPLREVGTISLHNHDRDSEEDVQ